MQPVTLARAVAALLLAVPLSRCGPAGACPFTQSILFSDAYADNVYLACPDGSSTRLLLSRTRSVGFEQAVGPSLQSPLAVVVDDETSAEPSATARLEVYDPSDRGLSPFPDLPGDPGWFAEAPDGRHLAFEYFPELVPGAPSSLYVADLATANASPLINFPVEIQMNAPSWRPDGREILFIQLDLSHFPGIITPSLVSVSYPGGQTRTVLGPEDEVAGVAFSPDGGHFAIWSLQKGLEIVDGDTLQSTLVLPLSRLNGRQLGTAGLIWGSRVNLIAFVLYDPKTEQFQLWDVRPDGADLTEVYAVRDGKLFLGSFIAGPWSAARAYPPG